MTEDEQAQDTGLYGEEVRTFNTAGPCDPRRHYMLPAAPRVPGALYLVDLEEYFVIHAPRQTGKTTVLNAEYDDDVSYAQDLGLLAPGTNAEIANPIYREVIVRLLTAGTQRAGYRGFSTGCTRRGPRSSPDAP